MHAVQARRGTPAKQFAHVHNLRCDKLIHWRYPLPGEVRKLSMNEPLDRELLKACLAASGEHMALFIRQYAEGDIPSVPLKRG
ncbi:hypothetical protein LJK88_45905 [Paenibacillus sp. P26]|nr:hypothetical protein LJK88_45905 [Paenibacillus sp. P26]